jgi:DNA-binding LytR/AlgR family response regulator
MIYSWVAAENRSLKLAVVDSSNFLASIPSMMFQTFLVGLLPTVSVIVLYNTFRLRRKISVVNAINTVIRESVGTPPENNIISLSASNLREAIRVDADSLLYITSVENYVEVHWIENGREKHGLLRSTLSKIEKDISSQCEFIRRCHHGYIVNLHRATSLDGNEAGYKIHLAGSAIAVPISKKYKKAVLRTFHR